jgi:hypothetical protein
MFNLVKLTFNKKTQDSLCCFYLESRLDKLINLNLIMKAGYNPNELLIERII